MALYSVHKYPFMISYRRFRLYSRCPVSNYRGVWRILDEQNRGWEEDVQIVHCS
jgi:hypothetical protein